MNALACIQLVSFLHIVRPMSLHVVCRMWCSCKVFVWLILSISHSNSEFHRRKISHLSSSRWKLQVPIRVNWISPGYPTLEGWCISRVFFHQFHQRFQRRDVHWNAMSIQVHEFHPKHVSFSLGCGKKRPGRRFLNFLRDFLWSFASPNCWGLQWESNELAEFRWKKVEGRASW